MGRFALGIVSLLVLSLLPVTIANNCTTISLTATSDRAYVISPGYPTAYSHDQDVCWIVDVSGVPRISDETYVIEMAVNDTDMEKVGSSCYDYGEARDGSSASDTRLAKWCSTAPYPVVSSGSQLYVRFFSSSTNTNGATFKGFSARVQVAVRAGVGTLSSRYSPACTPFALSAPNATYTLSSPSYPALYPNSMDSCWVLYVDENVPTKINYVIRLQVLDSAMEPSSTCQYDDAQARDGDVVTASLMSMWCGSTFPGTLYSCGPYMYVRMRSDHFGTYRGFRAYVSMTSKDAQTCTLGATPLSTGSIIGIAMAGLFVIILVVVICVVCKMAKKKSKVKVRHVQAKSNKHQRQQHQDMELVGPAPQAKHPSYYNQAAPPPYPDDGMGGYQPPVMAHGAMLTTGYIQPTTPAYYMTNMQQGGVSGMPNAY